MLATTEAKDERLLSAGREEFPSGRAEGVERPTLEDFEGIYRQYSKRVYSLCLRMTGNEAEAQDLTQDAFLHLYRKLDTFRGDSSFFTWFYRLAVNVVLMHLRKKRNSMETPLDGENDYGSGGAAPPEIQVADAKLLETVDTINLQRALQQLPPGFKVVFVLHDIEGYDHREISKMIACSVGTSKSQLHRARLRMRELLTRGWRRGAPAKQSRVAGVKAARPSLATRTLVTV